MSDAVDPLPEIVRVSASDAVVTLTMDSPGNRNALSRRMLADLTSRLEAADRSPEVKVVVLTHTGTTFCSGVDLAEAHEAGMVEGTRALLALLRTIVAGSTPVVAVVRGHVRAGGVGLLGACDFALVSDASTFAFTEARLGLAPAIISLTTRSRLGERDAARKYLTGEKFDGREAAASGLVTVSVDEPELDAAIESLLAELTAVPSQGLRETKRLLNETMLRQIDLEGDRLVERSATLFGSPVVRAAMAAFKDRPSSPRT